MKNKDNDAMKQKIIDKARELGFADIGFTTAAPVFRNRFSAGRG